MSRRRRDGSPPEAFEFFIGGYMGTSHRVVWEGGISGTGGLEEDTSPRRWTWTMKSHGRHLVGGVPRCHGPARRVVVGRVNTFQAFLRAARKLAGVDGIA